jgi:hypothetical protein
VTSNDQVEPIAEVAAQPRKRRSAALLLAGAGALFWLYTFYGIAQAPQGDGTGFQWLAVMPLGILFFALVFPALILALLGRALRFAIVLGALGLIAELWLWSQLLQELYH